MAPASATVGRRSSRRLARKSIEKDVTSDTDATSSSTTVRKSARNINPLLKLRTTIHVKEIKGTKRKKTIEKQPLNGISKKKRATIYSTDGDSSSGSESDNEATSSISSEGIVNGSEKRRMAKKIRGRQNYIKEDDASPSSTSSDSNTNGDEQDNDEPPKWKRGRPRKNDKRRKRVAVSTDDEKNEEIELDESDDEENQNKAGRKDIRKIKAASASQVEAYEEEKDRRKRIEEKQKLYNILESENATSTSDGGKRCTNLVLDQNVETKEVYVQVHPKICEQLKPHQVDGIRFMYQCTIESYDKSDSPGTGCILAHCMGLGKTFQVVAFLHTVMTNERLNIKKALVLAPLNVVLNWEHEFKYWLPDELSLDVWQLASVKNMEDRAKYVDTWQERGGILIMGYSLFLSITDDSKKSERKIKKESWRNSFKTGLLDPGPDVVVCDEGHILKNEKTGISKAVNRIKALRRICLTGTPLQNNLKEYYTMVQFVKPSLLGSRQEFANRFENPIKNGQYQDSTPQDVRVMKRRAHILHEMLSGCVQRQDYSALSRALPPKYEFVLMVNLSQKQIDLYRKYLREVVKNTDAESLKARRSLFTDFQALQRIWTHPYALLLHTEKMEIKERQKEENDFIIDDDNVDESDSSSSSVYSVHDNEEDNEGKTKRSQKNKESDDNNRDVKHDHKESDILNKDRTSDDDDVQIETEIIKPWTTRSRDLANMKGTSTTNSKTNIADLLKISPETVDWYGSEVTEDCKDDHQISGKIFLLFEILRKCEAIGDKLLVFSQSLVALDIIENFLNFFQTSGWSAGSDSMPALHKWRWAPNKDYFRLDGSTPAEKRKAMSKIFNDPTNLRARLFLISTRAGSLGMNLFGANRVVIFDTNWNPTHDTQSMFRVYRFGQTKPVYIYRLIAHGTMEAKIYERGVTKQSLACRVVDEQQIDRHFLGSDLEALYDFTPHEKLNEKLNTVTVPKDRLLADLLFEHKKWILTYHEHDSLLQNLEEEQLTKEERQAAWDEYEQERRNPFRNMAHASNAPLISNMMMQDRYLIFSSAMPQLKMLVDQGDFLIRSSGEKVDHSMESIVRNWIATDPEIQRNPTSVITKTQELVQRLRAMLEMKARFVELGNNPAAGPSTSKR